jgi:hypothetical protein
MAAIAVSFALNAMTKHLSWRSITDVMAGASLISQKKQC